MPELVRGRYAPSPTGALHVGNARTALLAWLQVRALGGSFVLRIEDLDGPRTVAGAAEKILADLRWLGLDWDEGPDIGGPHGPYRQSERTGTYEEALAALTARGRAFECYCSRHEVARAASAPHGPQDDGPRYPGTCRALSPEEARRRREAGRSPALRFRVAAGSVEFVDGLRGRSEIDLEGAVGDFVVRRADGVHAYQLAVALDDARMGITHVLRGDDLVSSTPRQIQLLDALGLAAPHYTHVPLLLDADGRRLAKRSADVRIDSLRARGIAPERLVAQLARSAGLTQETAIAPRELVRGFEVARIARASARFDSPGPP
jgi:glutamyl-tRNA synthetase